MVLKKVKYCKIHKIEYTRKECSKCYAKAYMKNYVKTHRQGMTKNQLRYQKKKYTPHPRIPKDPKVRQKAYYRKNRELILEKARKYYEANKEKVRRYKRKWYKKKITTNLPGNKEH